ncbi:glycosyltransferase domain-containing protein [Hyunsoonleella aestuarii]|uniref:TOD1/MUCI70 glycosyltransferase-like domain-containing protein n=1 Tax=Hyunsoonleella aestuarii TaxID=912802 RepID=A0ABP8E6Y3_9FLAO|nr:glycosyltransferase domain-containing protein [Hyunsoonleella aestuarii]
MACKIAIYTAVFGGKDQVREPLRYKEDDNIDYFLISDDQELKSDSYKIIYKKPIYDDITKNARYYKIIGLDEFKSYDFIIWHDANLQIAQDKILNVLKFVENKGIAFFKHSQRDCVYDEAIKCIQLEKDYPFKILKQVLGYYVKGIKCKAGLYDTSIVVKNNKLLSHEFVNLWWHEIKHKSRRDQLSLPYALKKFNIEPGIMKGRREKNEYSFFSNHYHTKYNFLSSSTPKSFNKWHKSFTIKVILILKKLNFNGL